MRLSDYLIRPISTSTEPSGQYNLQLEAYNMAVKLINNMTQPTVDVLDKIRAEIEKVFCVSVVTNELRTPMEVKTEILQIIDKYR